MSITVKNQFVLSFSWGGMNDFVNVENLQLFTMVENAGNILPMFDFEFLTASEQFLDVRQNLNEGAMLSVAMGKDEQSMVNCFLTPLDKSIKRRSKGKFLVKLVGLYNAVDYITNCKVQILDKKSGVETIQGITSTYFEPDGNIQPSQDIQYWIQHNVPDKRFVDDILLHTYLADSAPIVGITSSGKFRFMDLRKLVVAKASSPDWKFTPKKSPDEGSNEINYESDYTVDAGTGFINYVTGYEKTKQLFQIDPGSETTNTQAASPIFSSSSLDRLSTFGFRADNAGLINENIDPNYHNAFLCNKQYLSLFSATKIVASFSESYKPIQVLDIVDFEESDYEWKQREESMSGGYLVSAVSRNFSGNKMATVVELCRESLNMLSGSIA